MFYHLTLWMFIIYISNVGVHLQTRHWTDRQLFPSSKIPADGLSPKRLVVRRKIVTYHNFFRSKVRPTASNMLLMTWHPMAAQQAQSYAEKCIFLQHNDPSENSVPLLGNCGQNLFVANQKTPWFFAIKSWFLEYKNFTYGAPIRDLKAVGHYTQLAWASSHKLGCGVAHCKGGPWGHFYNYVCHYCPIGNINGIIQYPYKVGPKCADCPNSCVHDSLCANSCPVTDHFSNCAELVSAVPSYCAERTCNATCYCGNKRLYKNHPW
ncbi:serotriflin-like [Aricia agestis]|uniref:serotriflin-like n=1 Tax=Aricia agestis TaxID=91739 RepID=UPI001C203C6C|nr:serotriflin-like [Aricia agestis]